MNKNEGRTVKMGSLLRPPARGHGRGGDRRRHRDGVGHTFTVQEDIMRTWLLGALLLAACGQEEVEPAEEVGAAAAVSAPPAGDRVVAASTLYDVTTGGLVGTASVTAGDAGLVLRVDGVRGVVALGTWGVDHHALNDRGPWVLDAGLLAEWKPTHVMVLDREWAVAAVGFLVEGRAR